MRNQRQGVRSTGKFKAPVTEATKVGNDESSTNAVSAAKTTEQTLPSIEKKDIFIYVYDPRDTLYTDQTGKFGQCSGRSNNYQMVGVEIDSNSIWI